MDINELAGQTLADGQYMLISRLGGGNFGTVYRARELMNGAAVRDVAIKLYKPEATRLGNVEGMLEDCALPAKIMASDAPMEQKRHFVPIYSFGRMDTPIGQCAYVSMELVRGGETIEDVIKRCKRAKRFPGEAVIAGLMKQFFTALSLAHREGVLHRDIKGANVMLQNGVVRVMDFGMGAYADRPDADLKTTMSIYAPENFDGVYTKASDIYQAGLMFYELYTGFSPFADKFGGGDMLSERKKRLDFEFLDGAHFVGSDPSALLDGVLSRCLRFNDKARYSSAEEVLNELGGANTFDAMLRALDDGDYQRALTMARQPLDSPRMDDARRLEYLIAMGRANAGLGEERRALEAYNEALKLAEATGAYFHNPSKHNALIDAMCILYLKLGQSGTAKLFARKKR